MADKEWRCPFCGSKTPTIETPFLILDDKGNHVKKTQPCCRWQASNVKWQQRHVDDRTNQPLQKLEDVSKWGK